jgi:methionyl aminopeptidase
MTTLNYTKFLDSKSFRDEKGIGYYFGKDYEGLKAASSLQAKIRDHLLSKAIPNTTTQKLNNLAIKLIKEAGASPLFKGYDGFPDAICASVNNEIVHGTARNIKLKKGDVLSLDLGVKLNGFCGDSCRTIIIGNEKNDNDLLLIKTAEAAYEAGLAQAFPGKTIGDIGWAILTEVRKPRNPDGTARYTVFKSFMGHGIGHSLHERPHVPNFGIKERGTVLKPGMCICIEPVLIHDTSEVIKSPNDIFTMIAHDGKNACHYENQVYISENGPIQLT